MCNSLETCPSPICYCANFHHSRSNRIGIVGSPKKSLNAEIPIPWNDSILQLCRYLIVRIPRNDGMAVLHECQSRNMPIPTWYHDVFDRSGSNGMSIYAEIHQKNWALCVPPVEVIHSHQKHGSISYLWHLIKCSLVTLGPSHIISDTNGNFKMAYFFNTMYLMPPIRVFSWNFLTLLG